MTSDLLSFHDITGAKIRSKWFSSVLRTERYEVPGYLVPEQHHEAR
jgi:hypothetical protein